ncbi:MAG TPA: penicillin-binding protein 2 [Gaiella sp.]|nr:penicillin-binding protein 2 [Gaiella sp.]
MSEKASNARIRFLVLAFAAVFAVALGRAAYVQVVQGDRYEQLASRQHRETIEIPAARGTIYDRTGEPLAIGEQATTVYADPRNVVAPMKAATKAGETLGLDPDELYPQLRDRTKHFLYVRRKADPIAAKALQKLGVAGFGFYSEERRAYPQGRVAAHVLGYAGTDNQGLDGLERSLDKTLAGKPGFEIVVRDPAGRAIDVVTSRRERAGRNVVLTLDHQLQASAEQLLSNAVGRWRARGATAIVMDPHTGAILAMANAPTFDANAFSSAPAEARRNRAVTDLYEPGSTFKIVTVAAALEDNVVAPDTSFRLAPTIDVADRTIREAHTRGTETMTVRQILAESSNVGTITIAQRLGGPELATWVDRFGFGKRTGVDFPGESPGMVLPYEDWSGSTIGTVPIGQGIAVTPLQMVSAYAAIGNGGVIPPAHLIAKVGGKKVKHGKGRRVVSRHTADRMTAMFRDVVVEGTGTEAAIPGYTVAGKTGTANKAENGRYVSKYVASFVGLVPARNPRLAILVMVDEPRGQIWGGVVAAPIFRDIARFALQYLEVPPDAPESKRSTSLLAAASLPTP